MKSFAVWWTILFGLLGWFGGLFLGLIFLSALERPWYIEVPIAAFLGLIINNQILQHLKGDN